MKDKILTYERKAGIEQELEYMDEKKYNRIICNIVGWSIIMERVQEEFEYILDEAFNNEDIDTVKMIEREIKKATKTRNKK